MVFYLVCPIFFVLSMSDSFVLSMSDGFVPSMSDGFVLSMSDGFVLSMSDGFVCKECKCKIRNFNTKEGTDDRMNMWSYYTALTNVFGCPPTQ